MKKMLLLLAVFAVGVMGVMNVAIADKPDKVTVCKETGSAKNPYVELQVSAKAAENGNWYAVGGCPGGSDDDVVICHNPDGPNPMTMTVPESALGGHLGHGDTLGACDDDDDDDDGGGGGFGGGGKFRESAADSNDALAATR